jgi:hypothetical protein
MIKVALGENPQKEKPFPKLVTIHNGAYLVEVWPHPELEGKFIGIHREGQCKGVMAIDFHIDGCIDYNEPITIQNA